MSTINDQILDEIDAKSKEIERLKQLASVLVELGISKADDCVLYSCGVDWNGPTRKKFAEVRRLFPVGTRWNKTLNGSDRTKVDYETQYQGFHFRLWNAPPPPSCRVEYEEKFIEAHVERIPRLVCKGDQ